MLEHSDDTNGLIRTTRAAVICFVVTGFFALTTFYRAWFSAGYRHSPWLMAEFFNLPKSVVVAVNLLLYGWLLWMGYVMLRVLRGKERLLASCWLLDILVHPAEVVPSAAVVGLVEFVKALAMATAFFAGLDILLKQVRLPKPPTEP